MEENAPLILLHGALGSKAQFQSLQPLLEPHFQLHMLDLPGHGKGAEINAPLRIETMAAALKNYIRENELVKPHIFGYSMGGYIALWLESREPETFADITTLATKFDWTEETSAKEAAMLNAGKIREKVPQYAEWLQKMHGENWEPLLEKTAEMMLHLGKKKLIDEALLQKVQIPVRVAVGDRDKMVSLEETVWAYRNLPKGELQVLPNTPHPLEKVEQKILVAMLTDPE
ncbi:MAG: alpha/beta fold hydrolase [Bacteroidia bacterium]